MTTELLGANLEQVTRLMGEKKKKLNDDRTWQDQLAQFKQWTGQQAAETLVAEAKAVLTHARTFWFYFGEHETAIKAQLTTHPYAGLSNKQALWQAYCEVMVIAGRTPVSADPLDKDLKAMIFLSVKPAPTPPADEEWPPL